MNIELRNRIYNEVIAIGDEIISTAQEGDGGCSWITMDFDKTEKGFEVVWRNNNHLYGGAAGIVLYLVELYRQTGEERYRQYAIKGAKGIVSKVSGDGMVDLNLYHGSTGVSLALLEVDRITTSEHFYDAALGILNNGDTERGSNNLADVLNGYSGCILGLLKIYSISQEKFLLKKIEQLTRNILDCIYLGYRDGIYWDRLYYNINGLCGFSHGAAGVGLTFLELGNYFNNPAFFLIAEKAFLYENCLFNKRINNWPDLRTAYEDGNNSYFKQSFLNGQYKFFHKIQDMAAWCHGAPGIGLSRLRAFEIFKRTIYERDIRRAISKTKDDVIEQVKTGKQSHVLCHGLPSNALLFIEAFKLNGQKSLLRLAENIAVVSLDYKTQNGGYHFRKEENQENNLALFTGKTGMGYFYLKCLNPVSDNFLVYPKINKPIGKIGMVKLKTKNNYFVTNTKSSIKKQILSKYFYRTLYLLERYYKDMHDQYFNSSSEERTSIKKSFLYFIKREILHSSSEYNKYLNDVFRLERTSFEIDQRIRSFTLIHTMKKTILDSNRLILSKSSNSISKIKFNITPGVKIVKCLWNWEIGSEEWKNNILREPDSHFVILVPAVKGTLEVEISTINYLVLSYFSKPTSISEVKKDLLLNYNSFSANEINQFLFKQIEEFLNSGMLSPSGKII